MRLLLQITSDLSIPYIAQVVYYLRNLYVVLAVDLGA